jgi:chaperonin GroES
MISVKGKKILITPIAEELASGMIIPDGSKPRPSRGIVFSVGTEVTDYKPEDIVIFPKGTGVEIEIDGHEFLLIHDSEGIIGTITPAPTNGSEKVLQN